MQSSNVQFYPNYFFVPNVRSIIRWISTVFTLSLFIFLYHQNLFRCTENSLSPRDRTPSVGPLSYPDKCLFFISFLKNFYISNLSTLSAFIDLSFFLTSEDKQFQCSLVCRLWFCLLFISCFFLPRTARSFFPRS